MYATIWSLLPPLIAIILALVTKEVYSALFIGILAGGLMWSGFGFEGTITHVFNDGIVASLSDSYNVGILVFLVILGILVNLMTRTGGSAAFGRWASKHIKTRIGAQLATMLLGILIFVDDYFNCLTVGSVMKPITDKHQVSRAKLAYLIDATAAPVCIIAPISSWAAAVSGFAQDGGFSLFINAIPYNFYALLTLVMMVTLIVLKFDFGPMKKYEDGAIKNNDPLFGMKNLAEQVNEGTNEKGIVLDLVFPVVLLIISCVVGMIYTGGFFSGETLINAFSNADASVGLTLGSAFTLFVTIIYYLFRRVLSFKKMMACIPEGFKSMVSAILILTLAWTLKAMTDSLGAKEFIAGVVETSAGGFQSLLPAIIFAIAVGMSFATGTSWGTFGILIPITISVFPVDSAIGVICVSACMAGAVCGDHCSPISDTTIMSSAGADCDHVVHVSTQLPYALTCAVVSFITYIFAGFIRNAVIVLPIGIVLMVGTVFCLKRYLNK